MSVKDLILNKKEVEKLVAKQSSFVLGRCRYCGGEVENNSQMVKINVGRGNGLAHLYCANREIKRLKAGLIRNNPLYEIVRF